MTARRLLIAAAIAPLLALSPLWAGPPSDSRIDEAIRSFERGQTFTPEEAERAAKAAVDGLAMEELSAVQIGRLLSFHYLIEALGGYDRAMDQLAKRLEDRGGDGAAAAVHTLPGRLQAAADEAARLEILRATLTHPGLEEAIRVGGVPNFFARVRVPNSLAHAAADEIAGLQRLLTPELAPRLATSFPAYYETVQLVLPPGASPENKATVEAIRSRLVELATGAAGGLGGRDRAYVSEYVIPSLDGAFARGTLMGGQAPALTVTWTSNPAVPTGPATLEALKGNVVVLDFWATWCGPCVASFPKIRELVARYEGHPVIVIGVTSLQGSHHPGGGEKPINTKGEPEREHALMAEYIKARNITWPIVFTQQSCANAEYGVRGIPHVTIIDPAGNVRHNNLHPGRPLAETASLIDRLLVEFGLPVPDPVAESAGR